MKSFLDRFRRKGSDDEAADRKTESARDLAAEALQKRAAKAEVAAEAKPAAPAPVAPPAEGGAVTPNRDETITFTLGDFLPRIPTQLLVAGEHDATSTLTFDVAELSARIAKGQTTIPLCEVYRRVPKIFRGEIRESDNIEIRFPWQKLLELVKAANSPNPQPGLTEAAAEALAQKLRGRKRPGGATAPAPAALAGAAAGGANAGRQPNWFSRPTPVGTLPAETKPGVPEAPAPAPVEAPAPVASPAAAVAATAAAPAPPLTLAPAPQAPAGAMTETQVANEIERICQSADEEIARLRNGFQETVSFLEQDKTKLVAERDQAVAELATARRKEAAQAVASATFADQDTLRREIDALRANVEAKNQEIHSLQAQLSDAHLLSGTEAAAATQEQEQEISALRAEADARDRELSALRQRLEQIENTAQGAVQQRTTADEQVRTLTKELEDLRAETKTQGSKLSQEQANFAQLQKTAEAGLAAITAERDQLKTRADAQQAEVGALQQRLEQFSQAAKAEISEADTERERLRDEAEVLFKNLAAAQGELDELKKTHETREAALAQEREAFNQQKQQLAEQVTLLQKAESSRSENHRQDGDASRRETQRQVEELQRRILGLETTQKEVAQELSKERELRIKAERNASAADRARTETTALLESTRNEARRDTENRNRKQDGELSRVQKELQEKIDSLSESQSKIKAERDQLQNEVNRLKAAEATAGDWQSQTVASLEADVSSYRDRIKALLKERDEWQKQHEQTSTAHTAEAAALTALQLVHDKLSGEATTLRDERQGFTTRVTDLEGQLARSQGEIENLRQQLSTASQEAGEGTTTITKLREELASLEKTRAELDQNFTAVAKESDAARQQHAKLQAELDELKKGHADLAAAKAAHEQELQKVRNDAGAAEKALSEKLAAAESQLTEFEKLKADFASAQKGHAEGLEKVRSESTATVAALTEKLAEADKAKADFERQLAESTQQRDAARKRVEKLQAEVDELAQRPAIDPTIAAELEKLKTDFASAQKSHAEGLEKVRNESTATVAALSQKLAEADKAKADFERQLAESTQQRDAARKRVEKLQAEVDELVQRPAVDPAAVAEFEKLKADFASAQKSHAEGLEKVRVESTATVAALTEKLAEADKAKAEFERQLAESTQQRDAARKRVEKLQAEVDELLQRPAGDPAVAAELEKVKADLAASRQTHTESVQKARGESTAAIKALSDKVDSLEKAKVTLEQGLTEAGEQRDAARKRVEKLQAEVEEFAKQPAVDPSVAAELEKVKGDLAAAQQSLTAAVAEGTQQLATARESHDQELKKLRSESAAAAAALNEKVAALEKAKGAVEVDLFGVVEQRDTARKRVEKLQTEVDEFAKRPAIDPAVTAELEKLKADLAAAQQKAADDQQKAAAELTAAQQKAAADLAAAQQKAGADFASLNEKLSARDQARVAHERELVNLREQVAAGAAELQKIKAASEAELSSAREQHVAQLQAAQAEASTAAASLVQLRQQMGGFEITRTALEQSVATIARDRDEVVSKVRDLEARVQAAEVAASAKAAELDRAKAESEQGRAAVQAEVEKAAEALRKERDDIASELAATRERTRSLLSSNEKENRAALVSLTEERDASRRDSATLAQRLAEARLEAEKNTAQQQQQIDKLKGDMEKLAGDLARARETFEQQSAVFARELKTVSDQRDKAIASIETNQREMREKAAGLDESRAQAERIAEERIGRLDREVVRLRRERDQVSEQRDELRDRISAMADAQQRLVKEIALQATKTAPQPTDVVQKSRDPRESNVIDISEAEVLQPGEPESDTGGVRPPRLRPVMIPPPNVRVL